MKFLNERICGLLALVLMFSLGIVAQNKCKTPYDIDGLCVPFGQCDFAQPLANHLQNTMSWYNARKEFKKWFCMNSNNEHGFCCDHALYGSNSPLGYEQSLDPIGVEKLKSTECGFPDGSKVAHGKRANLFEFPWMALLIYNSPEQPFKCGGTLITDEYVLTAAHCVHEKGLIGVRLGEYDVNNVTDYVKLGTRKVYAPPVEDYGIEKVIPHPDYSYAYKTNDVALIKLNKKVKISGPHIKRVCLPITEETAHISRDQGFLISGWGYVNKNKVANVLQKAILKHKPRPVCKRFFRRTRISDSHICAGGDTPADACNGDSGGPLVTLSYLNGQERYVQLGIVSFGNAECGENSKIPGIYSNVVHVMPWITQNIY